MARALAKSSLNLLWQLLGRGYEGAGKPLRLSLKVDGDSVPVLLSGQASSGRLLVLSTGFASRVTDYEPLARLFEPHYLLCRVGHPGSERGDGAKAFLRLLWAKWIQRSTWRQAAIAARSWIHRRSNRERRLSQLLGVLAELQTSFQGFEMSLAGHSYGTDTVLRAALEAEMEELFLFSPHPPGYLLGAAQYLSLNARQVWVISGTKDYTRDGVGPEERLRVAEYLDPARLRKSLCLEGVRHMDFAFPEEGSALWRQRLAQEFFCR